MGSSPRIVVHFFLFLISNLFVFGRADSISDGLHKHSEVHEAKNLIDALSSKLHLNLQTYQSKYDNLQKQSNEYLKRTGSTQNQIKMLNELKGLLNDITKTKTTSTLICDKLYSKFGFTAARQIIINSTLPKDFTVSVQVNHRDLVDRGLAQANGNDLRVYYKSDDECEIREIDRIVENVATTKTKVLFKMQVDMLKTVHNGCAYYLVYGKEDAGKGKRDPKNVFLFYEDFSDSNLQKNWKKIEGSVDVENGLLKVKTEDTPVGIVAVKNRHDWKDIEVELDFVEKGSGDVYLGVFLRYQHELLTMSGWVFQYRLDSKECSVGYFLKDSREEWWYKSNLTKPLSQGSWNHVKYRVVGDRFSHWFNDDIIHNNVQVAQKWMIERGTFGLGCRTSKKGECETYYDNIKVLKYVPFSPMISLSTECRVDMKEFLGLGTSERNAATSCKQIHDVSLHNAQHRLKNGVYWIKTAADRSVPTYCDLANGGWTLVGKVSGFVNNLYSFWLVKNHNVAKLDTPNLPKTVGISCIDARYLATNHASTVMLSSGENDNGFGSKWVQWSLPEDRESDTLWTHSVGLETVSKAKMSAATVTSWDGTEKICYQNRFGIMPMPVHGGSYPSASFNTAGDAKVKDNCMAVGVQKKGTTVHGWTQNGNGFDSPKSNSDWPNAQYNHGSPYVAVWLK